MKKMIYRNLWAYALGVPILLGIMYFSGTLQVPDSGENIQERTEGGKQANQLEPHELFYLDRNYPDVNLVPGLYQERLRQAMAYDKATPRSHRGLDYPWKVEGPGNLGGRINAIAVHPQDPNLIFLGYSQGGIYRSDNGGGTWSPRFDDQVSLSISHISFDPSNPDHVWASTGDVNISGYPFLGFGVYRSTDRGLTWQHRGLSGTGVLSKVLVDPNNSQIIYAGSMGYPSHKGPERGLFRSVDGGANWQKTLTIDDSTGVIDLVCDPIRQGHVYAAGWTRIRNNKKGTTTGPGTGLYKSEDFGETWSYVTQGLPEGTHSRTSIEISNDGTLFISYIGKVTSGGCSGYNESLQGIYKSTDGGMTWDTIPAYQENGLSCELFGSFGWYFEVLKVNPDNPLDMFLLGVDLYRSLDGGLSWFSAAPGWWTYEVHADKHDLVWSNGFIYLGTDGGAYATDVHQLNVWMDIENIPATQFYRTAWSPHTPDLYYGGAQDNGTTGGNWYVINEWPRLLGGDGFQPLFDPSEPMWMYALTQNGSVYFTSNGGSNFNSLNKGLKGARYWDMPFVISTQDPKILFCGSYKMFRIDMRDSIREWKEISPDLTRGDTILGTRYPAITAIAQSELDEMRLYAGTQDGLLWTTADGGMNWENITEGTPGYFVTSITCSSINPTGVIATYSGYRDNDHQPYIYRSEDAGQQWEPIQTDLPMMGVNSFYILPGWNDAIYFAATDGGVYVSLDAGLKWERVGTEFPYMPVYDLDYNPYENQLIAATFSRGIMTFPIEELGLISTNVKPEPSGHQAFKVFPTLVNNQFTLDGSEYSGHGGLATIRLMNSAGQIVFSTSCQIEAGRKYPVWVGDNLSPGFHLVSISIDGRSFVSKIIVGK